MCGTFQAGSTFALRMRVKRALSIVELAVVVVVIGVIALIAVPRISRGSKCAATATLRANLNTLRSAIDRFAAEHGGILPGASGDEAVFWNQLTQKTNSAGATTGPGPKPYGPYLKVDRPTLPVGPNSKAMNAIMTTTTPVSFAIDEKSASMGWVYNYKTGEIIANTDDLDPNGVGYHTY